MKHDDWKEELREKRRREIIAIFEKAMKRMAKKQGLRATLFQKYGNEPFTIMSLWEKDEE